MAIPNLKSYGLHDNFKKFFILMCDENFQENSFQMWKSQYFPQDRASCLQFHCRLYKCCAQMFRKTMSSIKGNGECSHLAKGLAPGSMYTCNRSPVFHHFLIFCSCNMCPWSMDTAYIPDEDISYEPTLFC